MSFLRLPLLIQSLLLFVTLVVAQNPLGNLPCGLKSRTLASNLGIITDVCPLDASRTLVLQKRGVVSVIANKTVVNAVALDITSIVNSGGESGLLSCEVDPNFSQNGYIYLGYITTGGGAAGQKRISRFTMQANNILPKSELIILGDCSRGKDYCLTQPKPFHSIGALLFHPDGSLFVSFGDTQLYEGATIENYNWNGPQEPGDPAGKIIRINPLNGDGFSDNPFCKNGSLSTHVCRSWALGFRNPWAMSWTEDYQALLVSNVGWYSTEDLAYIQKGGNGGWPCYEGRQRAPQPNGWGCGGSGWISNPFNPDNVIYQYDHNGQGASIIGGAIMGSKYPVPYNNWFIGAEYVRGNLWANPLDGFTKPGNGYMLTSRPFANMRAVTRIKRSVIDGLIMIVEMEGGSVKQVFYDPTAKCSGLGGMPSAKPTPTFSPIPIQTPSGPSDPTQFKCIQSCNDGGNSLWVRVTDSLSRPPVVGCASQWSWNCTWYASSNCDGTAPPTIDQVGLSCTNTDYGSWCWEAYNQLVQKQPQTTCKVNPPAVAPPVTTSPWTCITSCTDYGHSLYARIVDPNTNAIGCFSSFEFNCTWYKSSNCDGFPAPLSIGPETQGVTCPSYEQGSWCLEAKKQIIDKQPANPCPTKPDSTVIPVQPTPTISVLQPTVFQNPDGGCLAYPISKNNRCGPHFGNTRCQDGACCSNLGWCSPKGYNGPTAQPWCESCLPGYGKCSLPAICPGTGFDTSVPVTQPPAKSPYKCIQSCGDKGHSLFVRVVDSNVVECASPFASNCTWYESPDCDGMAPPPAWTADSLRGFRCSRYDAGWCSEAQGQLLYGKSQTVCPQKQFPNLPYTQNPAQKDPSLCSPQNVPMVPPLSTDAPFDALTFVGNMDILEFIQNGDTDYDGPVERNSNVGGGLANDGFPQTINGTRFITGLGTKVTSRVNIPLNGSCWRFTTWVGIDDITQGKGWAEALLIADDQIIVNTTTTNGLITPASGKLFLDVYIPGVKNLQLVGNRPWSMRPGGPQAGTLATYSQLDWASPILYCGPTAPVLPQVKIWPVATPGQYWPPLDITMANIGDNITFVGRAGDFRGYPIDPATYKWAANLLHCQGSLCHAHPEIFYADGVREVTVQMPNHADCIFVQVELEVVDHCGRTNFGSYVLRLGEAEKYCYGAKPQKN